MSPAKAEPVVVDWTRAAKDDLSDALAFAGAPEEAQAQVLAQATKDADRLLAAYPSLGRAGRLLGTREWLLPGLPFFIVYRWRDQRLEVLRLMHSSRQWPPAKPYPRKKM